MRRRVVAKSELGGGAAFKAEVLVNRLDEINTGEGDTSWSRAAKSAVRVYRLAIDGNAGLVAKAVADAMGDKGQRSRSRVSRERVEEMLRWRIVASVFAAEWGQFSRTDLEHELERLAKGGVCQMAGNPTTGLSRRFPRRSIAPKTAAHDERSEDDDWHQLGSGGVRHEPRSRLHSRASRSKPRFEAHSLRRPPIRVPAATFETETSRASCDRPDPEPAACGQPGALAATFAGKRRPHSRQGSADSTLDLQTVANNSKSRLAVGHGVRGELGADGRAGRGGLAPRDRQM